MASPEGPVLLHHPALRMSSQPRLAAIARGSRIASSESDEVPAKDSVIRLEVPKSGHRREAPLSANADGVLARRWTDGATGYVFGTKNWYAFRTAWLTALRRAKIEDFRFRDLRHTFASWLVQRGRSLKEVQDALGHRTLGMTLRYSHLAPEHLRAAVAVLDDVLPAGAQIGHKLQRVTEATQTIPASAYFARTRQIAAERCATRNPGATGSTQGGRHRPAPRLRGRGRMPSEIRDAILNR